MLVPKQTPRIRDQNTVLVRIIKDERISPHRALFAQMQLRYFSLGMKDGKEVEMTPQQAKDKELMFNLLLQQYGNPKSIQWLDRDDNIPGDPATAENQEAATKLRTMWDQALNPTKE